MAPRTVRRWIRWWHETFPASKDWAVKRARLTLPIGAEGLPGDLLAIFATSGCTPRLAVKLHLESSADICRGPARSVPPADAVDYFVVMVHAAASAGPFRYKRHEPEKTLLYAVITRKWDSWLAERQADTDRSPLPAYVVGEFEAFLRCGLLQHGFLILSCEGCGEQTPVAFSCKKRLGKRTTRRSVRKSPSLDSSAGFLLAREDCRNAL